MLRRLRRVNWRAQVPALLTATTVFACSAVSKGKALTAGIGATGVLSSQVIILVEEAMKGIISLKAKVLTVLLAVGVVAGGTTIAKPGRAVRCPALLPVRRPASGNNRMSARC